jgi:hypothetical protein
MRNARGSGIFLPPLERFIHSVGRKRFEINRLHARAAVDRLWLSCR